MIKHTLIPLISFSCAFSSVRGIETITLTTQMPATEVRVVASREITLLPGFTATAADGGTFHARIGELSEVFPFALLGEDGAQPSTDRNYIRTRSYQTADGSVYADQIQYYDGLGRPDELLLRGITPQGKDLAALTEYDAFGRSHRQWLPAPVQGNTGEYVPAADLQSAAQSHYADLRPYAETLYENSPLNRVLGQRGAGEAWAEHPAAIAHQTNAVGEVPYFFVNADGRLQRNGNYPEGRLFKTLTTDEDGKTAAEYKDKLGQVVMTRSSADVRTCFVYDPFGQLAYVLPPLAVDALGGNQIFDDNDAVLKKFAYLYRRDERGNVVEKRLPGCEPLLMVYDRANRLVLAQDGNRRSRHQWTVNKYDMLGRPTYTGTLTRNQTREALKATLDPLVVAETFVGSSGFAGTGYTDTYFSGEITPLSVNYYDNYDFLNLLTDDAKTALAFAAKEGYDAQYPNAKGLPTGTRVYRLDSPNEHYSTALYYDDKGRVVQTQATNHFGGYEKDFVAYDFTGKILRNLHEHSVPNQASITTKYSYTYDHAGRQTSVSYKLNNNPAVTLAANTYDETGRLTQKKRHSGADSELSEYNIRNQPTRLKSGNFEENLYYNTNLPANANALYNGNIAATTWTYNGTTRGYNYTYDALNRLTWADYRKGTSEHSNGDLGEWFGYDKQGNITGLARSKDGSDIDNLSMTYNGNQLTSVYDDAGDENLYNTKEYHDRNHTGNDFAYDANGNMVKDLDRKIVTIKYNLLNLPDTVQFANGNQIINTYAADGRKLRTDFYTCITDLDEPLTEGEVLRGNSAATEHTGTIYAGSMEYEIIGNTTTLKLIHNPEGYFADNKYHYYRRDHLGNNREVWRSDGVTVQKTQYYPSGLPFATNAGDNPSAQNRKYNGKEFITMHGLDEYDSEARMYYAAIGRTTTPDPHAESYYDTSPYVWCANSPVNVIDPDGRDGMVTGSGTKEDPYMITANYYYQNGSLSETQVKGLNSAVSAYNNSGKKGVTEIKNADGSKSYVRYNLSAQGVDNVEEARLSTAFKTTSGDTRYYGNIVGTEPNGGDEYGSANNIRVDLNVDNINAGVAEGMNSSSLYKGVLIHEIGHNLGGEHSDETSVMDKINTTNTFNQIGGTTTTTHSYPSMSTKFTKIIFNRRDTPKENGSDGRIWTKKP